MQQHIDVTVHLTASPGAPPTPVRLTGPVLFEAHGDPQAAAAALPAALTPAAQAVLQAKLDAHQVALPTLATSLPYFLTEIAQAAHGALAGAHIAVSTLQLAAHVPEVAVAPAPAPPPAMNTGAMVAGVAGSLAESAASRAISSALPSPRLRANVGGFRLNLGPGSAPIGDQVKGEIKDRILFYGIGCGVLALVSVICVVSVALKMM